MVKKQTAAVLLPLAVDFEVTYVIVYNSWQGSGTLRINSLKFSHIYYQLHTSS